MSKNKELSFIEDLDRRILEYKGMAEENGGLTPDEQAIYDDLLEERKAWGRICGECDDDGQVVDESKINSRTIDVPYCYCPNCGGSKIL